ncbi:MAG: glycosyltransferase family 4 protein [Pseudomonadota bacterium]
MILVLTQCFPPVSGGIETYVAGFAEAASAVGRDVVVLADGGSDAQAYDDRTSPPYQIRRFGGAKLIRRPLKALAARRFASSCEMVLADSWKSLEWVDPKPFRAAGARIACLAHGMEFPEAPSEGKRRRIAASLAKADRVLANSTYTRSLVSEIVSHAGLELATPPISPQPDPTPAQVEQLSKRIGAASFDRPVIATLCRLEPRKGVDRVICALGRLKSRHPTAVFAVAGAGDDRLRLETLANVEGLTDRVIFLGRVDDAEKHALFSRADLFAMPTRRVGSSVEGFGIVYLEAGWQGAPALAGAEGGARDAVLDGETGLVCDGADLDAVIEALDALLGDKPRREAMGRAAAKHARENTWAARIDGFLG